MRCFWNSVSGIFCIKVYKKYTKTERKQNEKLNKEDIILTLSTCYNKNEKVVLHAKLIQ